MNERTEKKEEMKYWPRPTKNISYHPITSQDGASPTKAQRGNPS